MIEIRNLTKIYGKQTVLNIPELTIGKGESFGLVGNNGAGKTTMFRCILDLIRPNTGSVLSNNNNVASTETWKNYTGSYLDDNFLIDFLTPEEYFRFVADIYKLSSGDLDLFYHDFEDYFIGARSIEFSKSLNPQLKSFDNWLKENKEKIPLE